MIYVDAHVIYGEYQLSSRGKRSVSRVPVTAGYPARARASSGPPVSYHQPKIRSAKVCLGDNTAWDGQEKKLWVSIAVCFYFPVCLSHNSRSFDSKKNKKSNIQHTYTRACKKIQSLTTNEE